MPLNMALEIRSLFFSTWQKFNSLCQETKQYKTNTQRLIKNNLGALEVPTHRYFDIHYFFVTSKTKKYLERIQIYKRA